jgi:hypothetical protein
MRNAVGIRTAVHGVGSAAQTAGVAGAEVVLAGC